MIEKIVLDYLLSALDYPVFMETPKSVPSEYFILEKTGSGRTNHIDTATFAIQSISSVSLYNAAQMNEAAKTAMDAIIESEDVSKAALNSDYNFTNEETKQYRYQAVYDLVY